MAKPINLYQGQAPAAMAQMGQGMAEVGANIGRTLQRGYESMGQSIAGGIKAVGDAYQQYKDDEAKFNATKKMYKLFGESLDENTKREFDSFFADTSISTREKNFASPAIMQFLGAAQQQKGREAVANIMAGSRVKPTPVQSPVLNDIPTVDSILNSVIDQPQGNAQPQVSGDLSGLPFNSSQGNPNLLIPTSAPAQVTPAPRSGVPPAGMPPTKKNSITGEMEFWSPEAKRYIPEPKEDLYFGPNFRISPY